MPPKAEITKDKVLAAAFDIVREAGLDALTARNIARKLQCSTQPIYSAYGNMEEVKSDVYQLAVDFMLSSIKTYLNEKNEPAMNLAIGCLRFAGNEKHLFRTVFLSDFRKYDDDKLRIELYAAFLRHDDRQSTTGESKLSQLFFKLYTYWLGIATTINTGTLKLDIDDATDMIVEMYEALMVKDGLLKP